MSDLARDISISIEAGLQALRAKDAEIARLTAELEEARKDAGRYRWLRSKQPDHQWQVIGTRIVEFGPPGSGKIFSGDSTFTNSMTGVSLDDAIDAAMTKEKP